MAGMSTRILLLGTPDFAVPTLHALDKAFELIGVVTQPDRRAGRGMTIQYSPVKKAALDHDLPVLQPQSVSNQDFQDQLAALAPDIIVVAAYGEILPPSILQLPEYGCLNVHASLLPRWRGASPINAAVLHGDRTTGVTIMKMDPGLDTGPILSQQSCPIRADDTAGIVFERLAAMGANLIVKTIPPYLSGDITPRPQDDTAATYAPQLTREDGRLDFTKTADQLARQVRAYHPWPGSYTFIDGERLIVHKASAKSETSPGVAVLTTAGDYPAAGTGKGLLVLETVQPAGKSSMSGAAYLRGKPDWSTLEIS